MSNFISEVPGSTDKVVRPLLIDSLHPDWQEQAKCLGVGNHYFFGKDDTESKNTMNISDVRRAARLCDTCPVFRECITQAIMGKEEYGIWAGSTGKVRKNIRAMLVRGEVTKEEVIEDYCAGDTEKYRPKPEAARDPRSRRRSVQAPLERDVAI